MKRYLKTKLIYIGMMILLIFISVSTGQAAVSASRAIENNMVTAGSSTNVTVTINNDVAQTLSLQEILPHGWTITNTSNDADQFKASTNEWLWLIVENNTVKTVIYQIIVPSDATPGPYKITGNATPASGNAINVGGSNTVTVKMGSSSGSSSSSSGVTMPSVTETAIPTDTSTGVVPTITETIQPTMPTTVETVATPVETTTTPITTPKSPGFEIIAAIGILGVIYMLRRSE